jgi:hypothetical protein
LRDEAIHTYQEGLTKKEAASLRLGIIGIQLGQNKYKEALDETEKAMQLHPKDVRFQIYHDGLQKIKSTPSSEEKINIKMVIIERKYERF